MTAGPPSQDDLLGLLKDNGCILHGHFVLASGMHSDCYVQVRIGMTLPKVLPAFAHALQALIKPDHQTLLAASSVGGILLANKVAKSSGAQLLVGKRTSLGAVEWADADGVKANRYKGIVLVDDVITTPDTIIPNLRALGKHGLHPARVVVALDRRLSPIPVTWAGTNYQIESLTRFPLPAWPIGRCSYCVRGPSLTNYKDPERDSFSVIFRARNEHIPSIITGYTTAYKLQQAYDQAKRVGQYESWAKVMEAGVPRARIIEDNSLAMFVDSLADLSSWGQDGRSVLKDLVAHLIIMSNMRVEARSLGCTIILGNYEDLKDTLQFDGPLAPPEFSPDQLSNLVPYYDALPESEFAFLFDRTGHFRGLRALYLPGVGGGDTDGFQIVSRVTKEVPKSVGFILRRGRRSFTVYRNGEVYGVVELSDKSGMWGFNFQAEVVSQINAQLPGIATTLSNVLEVAREMVARGYGGIIIIGELPRGFSKREGHVRVNSKFIDRIGPRILADIAKLDGATVVSRDGKLIDAGVIIEPSEPREDDASRNERPVTSRPAPTSTATQPVAVNPHARSNTRSDVATGGRHYIAQFTSRECPDCAVVCVSQNGVVQIFIRGEAKAIMVPVGE